jgi:hypothetical protein
MTESVLSLDVVAQELGDYRVQPAPQTRHVHNYLPPSSAYPCQQYGNVLWWCPGDSKRKIGVGSQVSTGKRQRVNEPSWCLTSRWRRNFIISMTLLLACRATLHSTIVLGAQGALRAQRLKSRGDYGARGLKTGHNQ